MALKENSVAISLMLNHHLTGLLSRKSLSSGLMSKLSCLSGCWGNPLYWSKDSVLLAVAFACGKIVKKNPLHFFRHIPEISWCVDTSLHRQMFLIRYRVIAYFSSSVLTLYVPASFSCRNEMLSSAVRTAKERGKLESRSHTWMEHRNGEVGREGLEPRGTEQSLIR